jgi:hypothetical protein
VSYINGSYEEGDDSDEQEDEGYDQVGQNPTGRKRKSSAGQRRKKQGRLFGGTKWGKDKK